MSDVARLPLRTDRLVLEPMSHDFDDDLLRARLESRSELLPWMPWAVDVTLETQAAYADRAVPGWHGGALYHFAITEDGVAIGVIGIDRRGDAEFEIHYWLRTDRVSRGYVTESALTLLAWARDAAGARRIVLNAGMENRRSLAVAERLGFERDGVLEGGMHGGLGRFPAYAHHLDL